MTSPQPQYQPAPMPQRSVAGTTVKVLLTIFAVIAVLGVLAVVGFFVLLQLT